MQMKFIVPPQEAKSLKGIRYVRWIELLLTAAAGLLLWYIAQPLAAPGIDLGLGRRYAGVVEPFTWTWVKSLLLANPWQSLPNDIRAVALLRTAGYWLPALAAIGWIALTVARTGERWALGLVLFFWSGMGWLLRPFGWARVILACIRPMVCGWPTERCFSPSFGAIRSSWPSSSRQTPWPGYGGVRAARPC